MIDDQELNDLPRIGLVFWKHMRYVLLAITIAAVIAMAFCLTLYYSVKQGW